MIDIAGRGLKMSGKLFVGIFCAVLACSVCNARPKAVIGYGWEFLAVTTEDVHRNRAKFAESGVDGVIMKVDGCDADGKWFSSHRLPEAKRMWTDADFNATRAKLSEIAASKGLGKSLGLILLTPTKRVDWKDDPSWARMANNLTILGRTLKSGGFKGIALDHEDYSKSRQFGALASDPDFPEYAALVRRRGREVFGGFFREFPDAWVLGFWMMSATSDLVWKDFLNGMLDVMPLSARFIEGNEDSGYQASAEKGEFLRWAWNTLRNLDCFVAIENLPKYRQVLSVSFGQYMNAYVNGTNSSYYIGSRMGGTRIERLEENFADAARFCDDVLWIYGERGTLIDWDRKDSPKLNCKTWEERLPGFRRALWIAAGDGSVIEQDMARGTLTNLLKNSGCELAAGEEVSRKFGTWERKGDIPKSELYAYDAQSGCSKPGCIKLIGKTGCYTFAAKGVKPGEAMYLRYAVKDGLGTSRTSGGWMVNGKTQWYSDRRYLMPGRDLGRGWREVFERFIVPEGVDGFFFSVSGHASKKHPLAFDDFGIYVKAR